MKKQTFNWIIKALLAGLLAFALLCGVCLFYFNLPVRVSNADGATEYKYEASRPYVRGIEGFGFGKLNELVARGISEMSVPGRHIEPSERPRILQNLLNEVWHDRFPKGGAA
jgi:hypothetical protein